MSVHGGVVLVVRSQRLKHQLPCGLLSMVDRGDVEVRQAIARREPTFVAWGVRQRESTRNTDSLVEPLETRNDLGDAVTDGVVVVSELEADRPLAETQ